MTAASWRNFSSRESWPLAFAFIPPLALAFLVVANWVNVPLLDEWWTPALLFKEYFVDGHLSWHSLIAQHNESRKLFPRLIFLGCAHIFGWDTRVPMVLSWICCVTILFNLLRLQKHTLPLRAYGRALLLFFFGAILFSTNQWESWLWGIQLSVFIPPLCLTSCLLIHRSALGYGWKIILSAALSFIATFSFANGMLCWLLAFPFWIGAGKKDQSAIRRPFLNCAGGQWLWIGLYGLLAAGTLILYFLGYVFPANSPSGTYAALHKRAALHYLAAWIGSSFAHGSPVDPIAQATFFGTLVMVVLGLVVFGIWRRRALLSREVGCLRWHPWVILLLYGLISGLITTVGRLPFGIEQALASRYIAFSGYVFVGLTGLVVLVNGADICAWIERSKTRHWLSGFLTGLIALCFLFDWIAGYKSFHRHRDAEEDRLLTLRLLPLVPDNPQLTLLYPDANRVREVALPLFERNILREPIGPWLREKIIHPDGDGAGSFRIERAPNRIQISGWAMLPDKKVVPDWVVLTTQSPDGGERLLTAFIPRTERADIAAAFKRKALLNSGFDLSVATPSVQTADALFFVYAVELDNHRVFRLSEFPR